MTQDQQAVVDIKQTAQEMLAVSVALDELTTAQVAERQALIDAHTAALAVLEAQHTAARQPLQAQHDTLLGDIQAYHRAHGDASKDRDEVEIMLGGIRVVSRIKKLDPEFKWTAAGTRKAVAQLQALKLTTFVKVGEPTVDWKSLKPQCQIDRATGDVRYVDTTNGIDVKLEGITSTPRPAEHELEFLPANAAPAAASTDSVDEI